MRLPIRTTRYAISRGANAPQVATIGDDTRAAPHPNWRHSHQSLCSEGPIRIAAAMLAPTPVRTRDVKQIGNSSQQSDKSRATSRLSVRSDLIVLMALHVLHGDEPL